MILKTETGIEFQVDDEDVERVSQYKWYWYGGYIVRGTSYETIFLHVFIMGKPPKGLEWDHKNRDMLDCRKENLELVTHQVNCRNRRVQSNNTTGVAGVKRQWHSGRFRVHICVDGIGIHLGYFDIFEEAVAARKAAEIKYWGKSKL